MSSSEANVSPTEEIASNPEPKEELNTLNVQPSDHDGGPLQTLERRKGIAVRREPEAVFKEAPFKMILKCYVTKNNVSFVLTDVLNLVHYKTTGGNETKRGYLKNSQKIISKNIENVLETLKLIRVDYLYIHVKNGFGHRKHNPTLKQVLKLIQTLKKSDFEVCNYIANTTTRSISTIRLQGGRRGRR